MKSLSFLASAKAFSVLLSQSLALHNSDLEEGRLGGFLAAAAVALLLSELWGRPDA